MCLKRFAFLVSLMLILLMVILTCCVCVIRTAGFSHLHQCVPPERLKSTAKDFHVPVYIGNNKTELGASNHEICSSRMHTLIGYLLKLTFPVRRQQNYNKCGF